MKLLTILLGSLLLSTTAYAQDRVALVARIKADVIGRGIIPVDQTDNCHSFEITARVAWALRAEGALLFTKTPGQNGCTRKDGRRYSHDAIAFRTGGFADVLFSAGPPANGNQPGWLFEPGPPPTSSDFESIPGVAVPFDLDANAPPPDPKPEPKPEPKPDNPPPPPPPPPDSSLKPLLDRALIELAALKVDVAGVRESLEEHRRAWVGFLGRMLKYLGPAAAALIGGWQIGS